MTFLALFKLNKMTNICFEMAGKTFTNVSYRVLLTGCDNKGAQSQEVPESVWYKID